jgi:hypothetical protein
MIFIQSASISEADLFLYILDLYIEINMVTKSIRQGEKDYEN